MNFEQLPAFEKDLKTLLKFFSNYSWASFGRSDTSTVYSDRLSSPQTSMPIPLVNTMGTK